MNNGQTTPIKPFRFFIGVFYLLLFILVIVIASIIINVSGIGYWLHTHPQYNGKVTITEEGPLYPGLYPEENNTSASISSTTLSVELKRKSELRYPYRVYGDNIGNVYVAVEVQKYGQFGPREICKIYKVEGDDLKIVQNLPRELWCYKPPTDGLVTDFIGNWLVLGMAAKTNTTDVYKIEGTTAVYVPQFTTMVTPHFYYYTANKGFLYVFEKAKYYKVTFTP